MTWLAPLGFLGLIGLIILIIIYIIKPNYQLKYISTTYVWKRSLKFKKKRLLLNKLRNILLFLKSICVAWSKATTIYKASISRLTIPTHTFPTPRREASGDMTTPPSEEKILILAVRYQMIYRPQEKDIFLSFFPKSVFTAVFATAPVPTWYFSLLSENTAVRQPFSTVVSITFTARAVCGALTYAPQRRLWWARSMSTQTKSGLYQIRISL